ncbi:MAG: hypothetical protein HY422_03560 [Candidatus Komeilibacteria bacterium]|nr:hypothetical protein [Candidatus Komeilibacteria bacterium]
MAAEIEELKKTIDEMRSEVHLLTAEVQKIRRHQFWASVSGYVKLLIVLIPLIVSVWLFQPQLRQLYKTWQEVSVGLESLQGLQPQR